MSHACAVCLDGDKPDYAWVAISECGHVFHDLCLDQWSQYHKVCPNCKAPFRSNHVLRLYLQSRDSAGGASTPDARSPGSPPQASRLEIRRLEALCESIEHALEERQAEVEKLQAKAKEDQKRIDTLCQRARVVDCALANAVKDRDGARQQRDDLQEVVKRLQDRNGVLEAKEMENAILNDISLDRSALAKLTRGKDRDTVIMTQQKILEERNIERNRFLDKVSLSCAAQRKAEQKVKIAEGENARLKGKIKLLKEAIQEMIDEKERAQLKQDFRVGQVDDELKRAERGCSHCTRFSVGPGLPRRPSERDSDRPNSEMQRGQEIDGLADSGIGSDANGMGRNDGTERNDGVERSFSDGDIHFEAEESGDEEEGEGTRLESGVQRDGNGENGTRFGVADFDARFGSNGPQRDGFEEGLGGETIVFPTAFVFTAEEDDWEETARPEEGQANPQDNPQANQEEKEEALEEVDGNAGGLDGLRIRRGGGALPFAPVEGPGGGARYTEAGRTDCVRPSLLPDSLRPSSMLVGRKGTGSTLVATVRNNILETKKPKFGYRPSRAAMAGGESVLGKRPPPPGLPPVSQRVRAPTTSLDSRDDESVDTGGENSGWRGRGVPVSQLSDGREKRSGSYLVGSKPVGGAQRSNERAREETHNGTGSHVQCQNLGAGGTRPAGNHLDTLGVGKANGILAGTAASGRGGRGSLFGRPPVGRMNRTAKVTDFFGKK